MILRQDFQSHASLGKDDRRNLGCSVVSAGRVGRGKKLFTFTFSRPSTTDMRISKQKAKASRRKLCRAPTHLVPLNSTVIIVRATHLGGFAAACSMRSPLPYLRSPIQLSSRYLSYRCCHPKPKCRKPDCYAGTEPERNIVDKAILQLLRVSACKSPFKQNKIKDQQVLFAPERYHRTCMQQQQTTHREPSAFSAELLQNRYTSICDNSTNTVYQMMTLLTLRIRDRRSECAFPGSVHVSRWTLSSLL